MTTMPERSITGLLQLFLYLLTIHLLIHVKNLKNDSTAGPSYFGLGTAFHLCTPIADVLFFTIRIGILLALVYEVFKVKQQQQPHSSGSGGGGRRRSELLPSTRAKRVKTRELVMDDHLMSAIARQTKQNEQTVFKDRAEAMMHANQQILEDVNRLKF